MFIKHVLLQPKIWQLCCQLHSKRYALITASIRRLLEGLLKGASAKQKEAAEIDRKGRGKRQMWMPSEIQNGR